MRGYATYLLTTAKEIAMRTKRKYPVIAEIKR